MEIYLLNPFFFFFFFLRAIIVKEGNKNSEIERGGDKIKKEKNWNLIDNYEINLKDVSGHVSSKFFFSLGFRNFIKS